MSTGRALSNQQILRATLIVLAGFLASGLLGFVRTAVVAAQFGTSEALDAFLAAQRIPEIIFVLVAGGALGSSFIPVYARMREEDEAAGWRLASAVMTLAAGAAALLGLAVALAAPWLVENILLTDSPPATQALTADMVRLMMITPFIFSISGLVMGILQSHGLFLLPSVAISMNNIGIMIGALLIAPALPPITGVGQVADNNIYGLAYGAVLSALLHLAVQLPGLRGVGARLRPLPGWRLPGVAEVLRLMGPRVLGLAVVQVNFLVNIILTDGMVAGSFTALTMAFTLMFFALGLIGQSVGSAVFPTLAALAAEKDMDGFKDRLANALRAVLFLSFPATVAFIVLGEPLVSIFERREWTAESTAATAWALSFYALGIAGFALLEVLSRAFYALSDTRTPVIVGIGAMLSNIALSLLFIRLIGEPGSLARGPFAGLALANSLTTLIEALVLWWLMRRRIGHLGAISGISDHYILQGAWRALAAAGLMAAVLLLSEALMPLSGAARLLAAGAAGGLVFFAAGAALGLPEARTVPLRLLGRFKRRG